MPSSGTSRIRDVVGEADGAGGQGDGRKEGEDHAIGVQTIESDELDIGMAEEFLEAWKRLGDDEHGCIDVALQEGGARLRTGLRQEQRRFEIEAVFREELLHQQAGAAPLRTDRQPTALEIAEPLDPEATTREHEHGFVEDAPQRLQAFILAGCANAALNQGDLDPSRDFPQQREILDRSERGDDLDGDAFAREPLAVTLRHCVIDAARRAAGHHQMAWRQRTGIVTRDRQDARHDKCQRQVEKNVFAQMPQDVVEPEPGAQSLKHPWPRRRTCPASVPASHAARRSWP